MGSAVISGSEDICKAFLGKMSNKFYNGRIDMKWLKTNFKDLPKDAPDVVKEQYAQAFILRMCLTGIFGQSEYVERKGVVDSVRDGGNT
ncbi:hypothetical protein J1N35_011216 [Gossypium stocksii]|uniref:Uncharacterized protein n=1 Tax=Gossypium stocksii TaxID=47602 RepID=A0A9D3W3U5_9ROSI|nr:hypothetical protein J1N35_011216 [Gossypium stocksii]